MQNLIKILFTLRDYVMGWLETLKQQNYDYHYVN